MAPGSLLELLSTKVRFLRQRENMTRKVLAEKSGLSERFVADVEGGKANISVLKLEQLAEALGVKPASLLDDGGAEERPAIVSLLGLRGAGKTSVGRSLADKLKVPFVELDQCVESEAGMRLSELFAIHGENYYRQVELIALRKFLAAKESAVLATGGGVVTSPEAFELLKRQTRTVWLKATPEEHWQRVVKQGDLRPMANQPQAMAQLRSRLKEREPQYAEAQIVCLTSKKPLSAVVSHLVRELSAQRSRA